MTTNRPTRSLPHIPRREHLPSIETILQALGVQSSWVLSIFVRLSGLKLSANSSGWGPYSLNKDPIQYLDSDIRRIIFINTRLIQYLPNNKGFMVECEYKTAIEQPQTANAVSERDMCSLLCSLLGQWIVNPFTEIGNSRVSSLSVCALFSFHIQSKYTGLLFK